MIHVQKFAGYVMNCIIGDICEDMFVHILLAIVISGISIEEVEFLRIYNNF